MISYFIFMFFKRRQSISKVHSETESVENSQKKDDENFEDTAKELKASDFASVQKWKQIASCDQKVRP